ncbi:GntR family transcriptional regulator [Alicyclobacillus cellulosilyticus]|uniref:GntR family transcriptional regulator n=1 Tax=Alicyclobacillus cellulosilyticus TaxID=1003997 RepID=A0A917NJM5_9BACL|nr:GntR family transcriptional regulator [Alicyclobacillus cellulosilyticus]GGJ02683.1 GntR family transcriptional regulator [Alicyclobacillus cellulosilyticus]
MKEIHVGSMRFSLDPGQPLYEQVLAHIRSAVARGELPLGARLPSVRELAQALQINPNTVMRAYRELEREGLAESHGSQGTYITRDAGRVEAVRRDLAAAAVAAFLAEMERLGFTLPDVVRMLQERSDADTP